MTIRISCIAPPIPTARFDYAAWIDGREEDGQVGYGPTAAAAIADLQEQLDEDDLEAFIQARV